jgi:hypothetical protein
VYLFNPSTSEWKRLAPVAGSPAPPAETNKTGTFGRFRYDAKLDVFVLVNTVQDNVYLYRPQIEPGLCRGRKPNN